MSWQGWVASATGLVVAEPNLYQTEFSFIGEVEIEADVEHEFGLLLGRRTPMPWPYIGISYWDNWWYAAMFDPHHNGSVNAPRWGIAHEPALFA